MSETRPDFDDVEDDGVLDPADSLDSDDLRSDVLDTGVDAGDGYRASNRFGTTADEQARGESLDQLLSEEEPDISADFDDDDEDVRADLGSEPERRAGRLIQPDEGAHEDSDAEAYAIDAGIDGAGAGAEEAAIHVINE